MVVATYYLLPLDNLTGISLGVALAVAIVSAGRQATSPAPPLGVPTLPGSNS